LHELTFGWFPAAAIREIYKGGIWEKNISESIHKPKQFLNKLTLWLKEISLKKATNDVEGEVVEQA
jgi:hypothetical protein